MAIDPITLSIISQTLPSLLGNNKKTQTPQTKENNNLIIGLVAGGVGLVVVVIALIFSNNKR